MGCGASSGKTYEPKKEYEPPLPEILMGSHVSQDKTEAEEEEHSFRITVTNLGGRCLQFVASKEMQIRDVKSNITREWEIHEEDQILLCGTRETENSEALASMIEDSCLSLALLTDTCITGSLHEAVSNDDLYHITAAGVEGGYCLDTSVNEDLLDDPQGLSRNRLRVAKMGATAGMQWRIERNGSEFRIGPKYLVQSDIFLDLLNPHRQPYFRSWAGYTGQRWTFEEMHDGYRLSTKWTPYLFLTYRKGTMFPSMQMWESSRNQIWKVRRCRNIAPEMLLAT